MKNVLLVDGDILVYRSCFAREETINWGDGVSTKTSDQAAVQDYMMNYMEDITNKYKVDKMIVALSDSDNFRKDILPDYKAQRKKTAKPTGIKEARAFVEDTWEIRCIPRLEADDVLAMLSTHPELKGNKVIFSIDKDFEQIPGKIINPNKDLVDKGGKKWYKERLVSELEAHQNLYKQILMGDRIDNYFGVPGIGEKKAEKLLDGATTEKEMWKRVLKCYKDNGMTKKEALVQARCARLLRWDEYDHDKKKVKLWTPLKETK